jgi:hypothetical protein
MREQRFAAMRRVLRIPRTHEWCLLALLVLMTDRYRWMMDDAFVYFRYADNLLFLGRGLVYNAGEYAEGFSSPLWMLALLPLRASGIDYYTLIRILGFACAVGYGAALIWMNRRLSPVDGRFVVNFPLAASAAHYGITTHFSSGLETPLVQLLAPLYAAALLTPSSIALQCVVALAPLVRAECGLLAVLYLPFALARTRRIPWWFLACAVFANGGWLLFRVLYYADFLPNTFYLKDSAHWTLGLEYWINVSETHHWPVWLLGLGVCAVVGRKHLRRETGARAIMFAAAVLYALYVARIGGDMLYHRYAALPVCLLLCALAGFVEAALASLLASRPTRKAVASPDAHPEASDAARPDAQPSLARPQLLAAAIAILITLAFGLAYPPQLLTHPFFLPRDSRKWRAIADPNWHRRHAELEYNDLRADEDVRLRQAYARLRASSAPPAPRIIVEGFCIVAFRKFDALVVHDYGLTDPVLARLPRAFGRPGHKLVQNEATQLARLKIAARVRGGAWYDQPQPPRWVQKNHDALVLLDRKLHNNHEPEENLRLALTRVMLR